jgi:hypothetical protein
MRTRMGPRPPPPPPPSAVAAAVECEIPSSLIGLLGTQQYSVELNKAMSEGKLNYETVEQLMAPQLVRTGRGGEMGARWVEGGGGGGDATGYASSASP